MLRYANLWVNIIVEKESCLKDEDNILSYKELSKPGSGISGDYNAKQEILLQYSRNILTIHEK